ncbi:hypothetical protein NEMBOFW57_007782 [Staphylotrichum longicolle]|uniref:Uncharacterized protein n=1 Tax=Staphylotrichum longicolle TaxID=669026 RepID=A0AAD4EV32_9PEZI|nr:hypothetical protein NEMBOFW57_007782 [Staphylotrichum longicolle]
MGPPVQPDTRVRDYLFEPVYLDHNRRRPEPPSSPNPDNNTPKKRDPREPPLATSPVPVKIYSQYRCPICDATIAEEPDADYIGNLPCAHRATCTRPACIHTYYGTEKMWAIPYTNQMVPLHCQAPGCKEPIQGSVFGVPKDDPEMERRREEIRMKEERRKQREDKEERKKEKKEKKKKEKERQKGDWGDTLGSRFWDCLFY